MGDDVSEPLGIVKWERPMNAQLAGMARGNFPSVIPKTDQERVQNLKSEIDQAITDCLQFEVTEKLEGSSMTVYLIDGEFGVYQILLWAIGFLCSNHKGPLGKNHTE
jgi:hypothetical protein